MMLIGMAMTLFTKNSRFRTIMNLTNQIQQKRKAGKALLIAALLFTSSGLFAAQVGTSKEAHIEALGSLLVQDAAQGRIEPFSTFASDVLRKISKHNSYNSTSAVEVLLGMSANPSFWKNEPLINVANPQLEKEVGAIDGYVSYNQLFDTGNGQNYRLRDVVEKTYQKNESNHNKYEKELLNVDERVNICTQIYSRSFFAFFPIVGDEKGKWTASAPMMATPSMSGAPMGKVCPHNHADQKAGMGEMPGEQMNEMGAANSESTAGKANPHAGMEDMDQEGDTPNPHSGMGAADPSMGSCTRGATGSAETMMASTDSPENMMSNYFDAVNKVAESGNWSSPSEKLALIKNYQKENGGANLPSDSKINLEISYNNWNIFLNLALIYGIIGALLILLHFVYIFTANKRLEKLINWSIYPLAFVFFIYTTGLGLRWYIADHAPWSNGYEAMVFVGWASSLAGLLFARKSPLAFAVTALLSAIALSVAAMSWMNPEITNLVPVLKSYWLIVHVAVITSSYGFLAMGAILGFLNLILMISRTKKNAHRIKDNIQEISYIIEMALIVGLFMLTVGTFLGGVWANESWGRYWGWDSKETWALVSVLVYAAMLHVRMIPKGNTPFVLSTMAVIGFSSVIMTFLGVNYYLSGMHSYGQGVAPTLPNSLFLVIIVVLGVVFMAFRSERKFSK
jgi:cytochrome c-type biogenesis protein CcsB